MMPDLSAMLAAGALGGGPGSGAAAGAAGGGALGGGLLMPGIGVGLAALGGLMSYMGSQRAKKENKKRYAETIGLLRQQGENTKNEIGIQAAADRANAEHDTQRRGLTTSTAVDAARNTVRDLEFRRKQAVDESVANRIAGVMQDRTDVAGSQGGPALAALGRSVAQLQLQSTSPTDATTRAKLESTGTPDGEAPATAQELQHQPYSPEVEKAGPAPLPPLAIAAQTPQYSNLFRLWRSRAPGVQYARAVA